MFNRKRYSRLPDTKVTQYLLRTTENRIKLLCPLELLNLLPHTCRYQLQFHPHAVRDSAAAMKHTSLGKTTTTKDVDRVIRNLAREARRLHLEERNLSSKVLGLFLV